MSDLRVDGLLLESNVTQAAGFRVDGLLLEAIGPQVADWRVDGLLLEAFVTLPEVLPVATAIFPSALLAQAGFSIHRRPTRSTRRAQAVSGREVTSPFWVNPLREWELTFEGLSSSAASFQGLTPALKQTLDGFWNETYGGASIFLFDDPEDDAVVNGAIATGDAATASFPLVRLLGSFAEPVGQVNALTRVAVNGATVSPSTYSLVLPNTLVFTSAPASGAVVTADFTYYWQCRFSDETLDFEEFVDQIHKMGSLKFRSVKP